MSKKPFLAILVLATVASSPIAPRAAAELPRALQIGDAQLALNGSGSRSKYMMTMYVAGLYLTKPNADGAAVVAADEPMAIRLEIASGFVTQEKLLESLKEGFAKSTGGKPEAISKEIEQFRGYFAEKIAKGDVFDFVYVPGQGVAVAKNGKPLGVVAGLPFKTALFGVWLSSDPVDADLKVAMLAGRGK